MEYGKNQYGILLYSQNTLDEEKILINSPDLMQYLPDYYQDSDYMINIQEANSYGIGILNYILEDTLNQMRIRTATWALTDYENEFGIETNLNYSYEERRNVLEAVKSCQGTFTPKLAKSIVEKFSDVTVDIIEHNEESYFVIKFIGLKGIPPKLGILKDILNIVKPAHLGYEFEYKYTTWQEIKDSKLFTWQEIKDKKLTWRTIKSYDRS